MTGRAAACYDRAMAAQCPLCRATLDNPREPCPSCGSRIVADATKQSERDTAPPPPNYERQASQNDPLEIAPQKAPPIAFARKKSREQMLEADFAAPLNLELDRSSTNAAAGVGADASGEVGVDKRNIAAAATRLKPGAEDRWQLDPAEVNAVAKYGPTPARWWDTPGYMRRVRARQAELEAQEGPVAEAYETAKTALEDALVAIGQRAIAEVRGMAKASRGSYLKTMDRLVKREAELKLVDAAVFDASERHRDTMHAVFEKIEEKKAELAKARASAPATAAAIEAELATLHEERDAAERAVKIPAKSLDPEVSRARADFRATCADFAMFVLDDRKNFGEDFDNARARVARLRLVAEAAEKKILIHRAAINAFDEHAMATGMRVLAAMAALAVVGIVGLVFALK